ncbi:MAG: calcium-binding protein [Pseudanabaena sp.]|nr:MAG: calcium-binding protein [Pseudanabaena sp.]
MNDDKFKFEVSEVIKALIAEEKLTSIVQMFTKIDSDRDGKIEIDEYLNFALAKEKIRLTRMFEAADNDKDGCIDFEEFAVANEPNFNILKKFRELDLDKNGLLSLEEAINIADRLVLPVNTEQIKTIIKQVDHDGDGQITYYEYLEAIANIGFQ